MGIRWGHIENHPDMLAVRAKIEAFDGQFRAARVPAGTPDRWRLQAEADAEAHRRCRLPENIAARKALSAELVRMRRSVAARFAAQARAADPSTAVRQAAQGELRRLGFAREATTGSGSNYYQRAVGDELVRVRLSDHEVPMSPERQHAADHGGFTWATHGHSFLLRDQTPQSITAEIREALGQ